MAPEFEFASKEQEKAFMDWVSKPENAVERPDYEGDGYFADDSARVWEVDGKPLLLSMLSIMENDNLDSRRVFTDEQIADKIKAAGIDLVEIDTAHVEVQ